ncbi:nickel ABC transporter permease [Bifidobacterium sp. DSM 109958]|uniref:Nickel ABC transporter permease n=1 Tax=Bifidobacterium moraviense TaxID=2675323 RepID=A0A7Y0F3D8_9BIFI|nr:DUF6199 family natural product biosynthesis protein [Bifidobacterium sp. DSM 109958]NMN01144.1 nickel ABC transporter permease [Bifidobacterium sp. DSM 109958]
MITNHWQWLLIALLFVGAGALATFKTELLWKIDTFLTVKGGEPSDFYLAMARVTGVLMMVGGVIAFVVGLADLFGT